MNKLKIAVHSLTYPHTNVKAVYAVANKQIHRSINAVRVTSNRVAKHGCYCNLIFGFLKIYFVGVIAQKSTFHDCGRIRTTFQKIFSSAKRAVFSAALFGVYLFVESVLQRGCQLFAAFALL